MNTTGASFQGDWSANERFDTTLAAFVGLACSDTRNSQFFPVIHAHSCDLPWTIYPDQHRMVFRPASRFQSAGLKTKWLRKQPARRYPNISLNLISDAEPIDEWLKNRSKTGCRMSSTSNEPYQLSNDEG